VSTAKPKAEQAPLAEERRNQILEAAKRCFKEKGFHQTTLRDIAQEFGMSVGHIYNYFDSKESLIETLVETETDRFIDRIVNDGFANVLQDEALLRERVGRAVDVFLDPATSRVALAIMDEASINPRIYEISVKAISRINRRIMLSCIEALGPEVIEKMPEDVLELKVVTVRSFLEGLRITTIFNPHIVRKQLREAAIDHIMLWLNADMIGRSRLAKA
jgi:TetR/AcrR family transcriptional regulator, repressor for uid operon